MIDRKLFAIPALIGLALAGGSFAYAQTTTTNALPQFCELRTTVNGSMQAIEGIVTPDVKTDGAYRFSVRSSGPSGSSNISQGGYFTALAGQPTTLGQIQLNASAKALVEFAITLGDKTIDCTQQTLALR